MVGVISVKVTWGNLTYYAFTTVDVNFEEEEEAGVLKINVETYLRYVSLFTCDGGRHVVLYQSTKATMVIPVDSKILYVET